MDLISLDFGINKRHPYKVDVASSNLAGPTNNKMAKEDQQVNVRIKDTEQFYSNEAGINFNPNEFSLDFKCVTHLHDFADHRSIFLTHNIVVMSPLHAKSFLAMLNRAINDYESRFGKIEKTEAIKKAEKIIKKEKNKQAKEEKKEVSDTYFG